MDNQKIIIIALCLIIVVLLVGICSVSFSKEDSQIELKDKSVYTEESVTVKLTDGDGNPISNEIVHVKIKDKNGKTKIDDDISTNSKGNAKFKIDKTGNYEAEFTFKGNDKFKSSSATENITVKKAATKSVEEQSSNTNSKSKYDADGNLYPEYGPEVDSQGITREEAVANNYRYIEMRVDGDKPGEYVTVGGYVKYDPVAGSYHT